MKPIPPSPKNQGVALVLVLCFVVLITGLVIAYFSRVLTTRQLANASTSTVRADMLANSATDVILGDLKEEIVNGSTALAPPASALPAGSTVYVPTKSINAVPQRNATPVISPAGVDPIPNLVRRSARKDSAVGQANYVAPPALTSRASAASSSTPSANGRSVSATRWNRHYLIPPATPSTTISLTSSTPVADFTPPDWVFVTAEHGPEVLNSPFQGANGGAVTPIGRYAYAIYDEGGLLDINQTGYPSVSKTDHIGAKPSPSYADLTQIGLTATNVDNLLAFRNYATLQATNTFPSLLPSATVSNDAYYQHFVVAPGNLLQVPLTLWNNKTDQAFLSRQQLISYFVAANQDPKNPLLPAALQYLGTFNRSLNQPSYVPEANRLPVQLSTKGGNNSGDNTNYSSNNITPNFLTARVVTTFTRYDGTKALVGEPLVKKRFPLNRLAWITYKGPSADRNMDEPDMKQLIADGITEDFLKQGSGTRIEQCFGLQWDVKHPEKKWTYIHGTNGNSGAILNVFNPKNTIDVTRLTSTDAREPDFFELLKASINPGSIAKSSLASTILGENIDITDAAQNQYKLDTSLDRAILQIGANIIDQFDTDGFPTQINYNLGGLETPTIVYGDENLPYISRVRSSLIRLVEASPSETATNVGGQPIIDTGVAALMNFPEVWNPHDWSSAKSAQSVGYVAPTSFKIYATTNAAAGESTTVYVWNTNFKNSSDATWQGTPSKSPGFNSVYHFQFGNPISNKGGETRKLSEKNTVMNFTLGSNTLFREPTILFRPGYPVGSQLESKALVSTNTGVDGLGDLATNPTFFASAGGLKSAVAASSSGSGFPQQEAYLGFYLGAHPLRFWDDSLPAGQKNSPAYQTQYGPVNDVTYTLACNDGLGNGDFILYDNKGVTSTGGPNACLNSGVDVGFGLNGNGSGSPPSATSPGPDALDYGVRYFETIDPRTSRFGMFDPYIHDNANSIPPRQKSSFVDPVQGTLKTTREGPGSGQAGYIALLNSGLNNAEWFPSGAGWYHSSNFGDNWFRPGLLSQNNPAVIPNGTVAQGVPTGTNVLAIYPPFYYSDPDGIVRRACAGNVPGGTNAPASQTDGLPLVYANGAATSSDTSSNTIPNPMDSRPVILNRPFRSVAELGYVYSGTPWKNLDFFLQESGDSALLDVFCINENTDDAALSAGQVNLNTRQIPVLQAILAQTNKDLWNDASSTAGTAATTIQGSPTDDSVAKQMAIALVKRTAVGVTTGPNAGNGPQPLQNVSDLVGRFVKQVNASSGGIDGKASYDGFTADLVDPASKINTDVRTHNIQRLGEGAIRALANAGQTRIWNLMFDLVAQTGRFARQATNLDQFNVEGEQHYWVHVAIDRYTGKIVDTQVEVVKE